MAKKEGAKKEKKAAKIPFKKRGEVTFKSFSFGATIPTQSFGNVQPRIEVEAENYEDARDFAIPKITELYERFCEVRPEFMGKITVTEKVVTAPKEEVSSTSSKDVTEKVSPMTSTQEKPKSPAVLKAEKAIDLAMTEEAANAIQEQIERSVKIEHEDKPALYTLCLKKKKEIAAKL